jgi:RNA recognition motif-containing protein
MKKRVGERTRIEAPDWGESSLRGRRTVDGQYVRDGRNSGSERDGNRDRDRDRSGTWCTVYVGNLAYKVTEESLQYSIESSIGGGKGKGTVADVRIATEEGTGRKKGFAFVDFVDQQSAEMAVNELQGMIVLGRPIRLDMEGPKLKARDGDRGSAGRGGGGGGAMGGRFGSRPERRFGERDTGRRERSRISDEERGEEREVDAGYDNISPPRFVATGAREMRSDTRSTRPGFSGRGRGNGRSNGRGRGDNMGRRFSPTKSSRDDSSSGGGGGSGGGVSYADDFYD